MYLFLYNSTFNYENVHDLKYWDIRTNIIIETGSLNLPKTLKKL